MTESTFSAVTLIIAVVALSLTSINKLRFAAIMARDTHTITPLGKWLLRMFTSMGFVLAVMAVIFFFTLLNERGIVDYSYRMRQTLRVFIILTSISCCISTLFVRKSLLPVLKDTDQERKERMWLFRPTTPSSDRHEGPPSNG